jgi:hypothetical protein
VTKACLPRTVSTDAPFQEIVPLMGLISPWISRSSRLFPAPFTPMITVRNSAPITSWAMSSSRVPRAT